jgi:hypothetical protein
MHRFSRVRRSARVLCQLKCRFGSPTTTRSAHGACRLVGRTLKCVPSKLKFALRNFSKIFDQFQCIAHPRPAVAGPSISHKHGLSATIVDAGEQMKFPLFALSFINAAVVSVSAAQARNYRWCSMLDLGDEILNCGFDSLEQCKASLSGGGRTDGLRRGWLIGIILDAGIAGTGLNR